MSSTTDLHTISKAETDFIRSELQKSGVRMDPEEFGCHLNNYIGLEVVLSSKVAMGKFSVSEKSCQPHGVLHGGVTAFIAESIASYACAYSTKGERVAGVEINVNHLRSAPIGTEVTVFAKALMQGRRLQVWELKYEIDNPDKKKSSSSETPDTILAAVARVTLLTGLSPRPKSKSSLSRM